MTINVTQHHIDIGKQQSLDFCPVALAIKDVVGFPWVLVSPGVVFLGGVIECMRLMGLDKRMPLPEIASRFVEAFDEGDPVAPFQFELEVT